MSIAELFYGLDRMPRHADSARLPHIVLTPVPLRLSTIPLPPDSFPSANDHTARQAALAGWLFGQCGLHAPLRRRFITAYLAWIAARLEEHAPELTSGLARFGELYAPSDWIWAAPRPLPRALVPLAEGYVGLDIAFWDGSQIIGILLGDASAPAGLAEAGVALCRFSTSEMLQGDVQELLTARLPASFQTYWRDAPLPVSPFRRPIPGGTVADQSVISST